MRSTSRPVSADVARSVATILVSLCGVVVTMFCLSAVWSVRADGTAKTHTVVMQEMRFSPPTLRIQQGDTIVFRNDDLVPHTATAKQHEVFDSGIIPPGESWTFAPKFHATVPYVCTFHPMMEGRIEVTSRQP